MIKCDLTTIEEIVDMYGTDWSDLEVTGLDLSRFPVGGISDMRKIILPRDKEFFQKQKNRKFTKVKFPAIDYREYNFRNIKLDLPEFEEGSVLPDSFFQDLASEGFYNFKMPSMDYSNFDFTDVDFNGIKFPDNCIFPKDKELFQKIKDKNLRYSKLPKLDFTLYNLSGVVFASAIIQSDSKLPENFFQVIKDKSIEGAYLPKGDYSRFNFKEVRINSANFHIDSKLPKNKTFFQDIDSKSIYCTLLPRGDYSKYDFKDVLFGYTEYTSDSKFPEYEDFLIDVYNGITKYSVSQNRLGNEYFPLTDNMLKNMHNYNLSGVYIDLEGYSEKITEEQLSIIRIRYKDLIGETIFLPEKSLMRDDKEIKDDKLKNKDNLTLNI